MRRTLLETLLIPTAGIVLVALRPEAYDVRVLSLAAVYAIAGVGLNVLVGYTGIVSVGHAAFLLFGAYAWALLARISPALAVLVGLLIATGVAWLVGWACLRFRGYYLAVATLAFGLAVWATSKNWEALTAGNTGIIGIPRLSLPFVSGTMSVYVQALIVLALCFWLQEGLRASRLGLSMLASRGDEQAARAIGVSVARVRTLAFVFSAVPTALAGALLAQLTTYVNPDQFEVPTSINLIAIPIIGGRGWRWAPLLGALFVVALPEYVRFLADYRLVVYGALLTAIALFFPDGLRQIGRKLLFAFIRKRRPGAPVLGVGPVVERTAR